MRKQSEFLVRQAIAKTSKESNKATATFVAKWHIKEIIRFYCMYIYSGHQNDHVWKICYRNCILFFNFFFVNFELCSFLVYIITFYIWRIGWHFQNIFTKLHAPGCLIASFIQSNQTTEQSVIEELYVIRSKFEHFSLPAFYTSLIIFVKKFDILNA